jgi:pimeloyl-ACP methyl ester carboxylesterase
VTAGERRTEEPLSFEGFQLSYVDLGEATARVRHGGWGPPLLLLHGLPQKRLTWAKVAGDLAEDFTVIAPEIGGYADGGGAAWSERAMARDALALMDGFGFAEFYVAGHDGGGRIAHRLALEHPDRVLRLSVLDMLPTADVSARADARGAAAIRCPVQVLWGARSAVGRLYDPLQAWSAWARDLRGEALDCGHALPEERPAETLAALRSFFAYGF